MKGFSVAMSHVVFFIATLIAVSIAVAALSVAVKGLSYAMDQKTRMSAQQLSTVVKIVDGGYDDANSLLWFYVKNLGQTVLDVNGVDIFLDGKYLGTCNDGKVYCVDESPDYFLQPNELMEVNAPVGLSNGAHRIRIVTQYGVYTDYEVIVG